MRCLDRSANPRRPKRHLAAARHRRFPLRANGVEDEARENRGPYLYALRCANTASSSSATILVILIIGLTAGPAVSLYGSPTVSPVTADLCASEPLPP